MKTTLFMVLLLTYTVCSAQPARVLENTLNSWNYQNLSVENWNARNMIISGTTDINPTTNRLCPVFKFTDPNLTPVAPFTYYTSFPDNAYLMDFTIDQNNGFIYLTGIIPATSTAPMIMYVATINIPTGAPVPPLHIQIAPLSNSMIPHQIIHSPTANQLVIVGTEMTGTLSTTNFNTIPKNGFMLFLNAATFAVGTHIQTNTPSATNDSDMLESVTEIPGYGYFAGGSANGFVTPNEQNMMVMNATYAGVPGPSCVVDNTNFRSSASSVMHNPATNQVIVLGNNSSFGTYELIKFNAIPVTPIFPSVRHVLSCFPTGTTVNGFRLQQNAAGTQVIVGGYGWNPSSTVAQLIPFQTTTNPGLGAFISAKTFQSGNNSPLTGYFNESGTPVFINTPDMITYHPTSNRTFLVNPNTLNGGFDMLRSVPAGTLGCEAACQFSAISTQWPTANTVVYTLPGTPALAYPPVMVNRGLQHSILCSSTPLAPFNEDPTLEAAPAVKLFPNPAKDHLEISAETAITEAVIYDLKGNKVLVAVNDERERGILRIDISMLKSGVYIIQLKDSEGTLRRERFVKE